jgi:chromosome partitioning protein
MRSILVVNPKGGSGKTTIATNIAVYYAVRGQRTTLLDMDPQASATDWLAARPDTRPEITGVQGSAEGYRVPRNTEVLVIDAPAGVRGRELSDLLRKAQTAIVPVLPSAIDLRALGRFHDEMMGLARVQNHQIRVATVANRVRETSPSRVLLEESLRKLRLADNRKLPFTTVLRQSQLYIKAAERGLGILELAPSLVTHELELWQPLVRWLNSKRSLPE